jgi:hypothetical protein
MDETRRPPENTREFVAMWHAVTEEHLVHKLTAILRQLSREGAEGTELGEPQAARLAQHVVRALQVAGSPQGGVDAAVQYLSEVGAARTDESSGP